MLWSGNRCAIERISASHPPIGGHAQARKVVEDESEDPTAAPTSICKLLHACMHDARLCVCVCVFV